MYAKCPLYIVLPTLRPVSWHGFIFHIIDEHRKTAKPCASCLCMNCMDGRGISDDRDGGGHDDGNDMTSSTTWTSAFF